MIRMIGEYVEPALDKTDHEKNLLGVLISCFDTVSRDRLSAIVRGVGGRECRS